MIEIKLNDGLGIFKIKGSHELLEGEMSVLVENLVKHTPELFIKALTNNLELLEKEVKF